MNPEREFWIFLGLFTLALLLPAGGVALYLLFYQGAMLTDALRAFPKKPLVEILLVIGVAFGLAAALGGFWLRWFYDRYVFPLHRLSEDVEAVVHGSPPARLPENKKNPSGLEPLLNILMERFQAHEEGIGQRLDDALKEVSGQKSRLESILDALSEGVVVFSPEGRIVRYNRAARTLFEANGGLQEGLPVAGLIQHEVVDFAREILLGQLTTAVPHPHVAFTLQSGGPGGGGVPARIAPMAVSGGRLEGFVLTVDPGAKAGEIRPAPAADGGPAPAASGEPAPEIRAARFRSWENTPLPELRYLVLDTETTGMNPAEGDRVISLAAVAVYQGRVLPHESFEALVDPGRPILPSATRVHGIEDHQVAGKPTLEAVIPGFLKYAESSVLVAHNAEFDLAFLRKAAREAGLAIDQPVLDTMLLSAVLHPHQPSHSLDALLARYGLTAAGRHTALGDAMITANLLLRLIPQLEQRGIKTLGAALAASRKTPLSKLSYS